MSDEEEKQSILEIAVHEAVNSAVSEVKSDHERKNEGERTELQDPLEKVNAFFGEPESDDDTPSVTESQRPNFGFFWNSSSDEHGQLLKNFYPEYLAKGPFALHANQAVPKTINHIMELSPSEWPTFRRVELDENAEICLTRNGDERVLTPEEVKRRLNRFRNFLIDAKERMFEEPAAANTIQRFQCEPEQVELSDHEYHERKEAVTLSKRSLTGDQSSGINGPTSPKSKAQRQAGKDDETSDLRPMATDLSGETDRHEVEKIAVGNAVDVSGEVPKEKPNDGRYLLRSSSKCPICQRRFSKSEIVDHAANCQELASTNSSANAFAPV